MDSDTDIFATVMDKNREIVDQERVRVKFQAPEANNKGRAFAFKIKKGKVLQLGLFSNRSFLKIKGLSANVDKQTLHVTLPPVNLLRSAETGVRPGLYDQLAVFQEYASYLELMNRDDRLKWYDNLTSEWGTTKREWSNLFDETATKKFVEGEFNQSGIVLLMKHPDEHRRNKLIENWKSREQINPDPGVTLIGQFDPDGWKTIIGFHEHDREKPTAGQAQAEKDERDK